MYVLRCSETNDGCRLTETLLECIVIQLCWKLLTKIINSTAKKKMYLVGDLDSSTIMFQLLSYFYIMQPVVTNYLLTPVLWLLTLTDSVASAATVSVNGGSASTTPTTETVAAAAMVASVLLLPRYSKTVLKDFKLVYPFAMECLACLYLQLLLSFVNYNDYNYYIVDLAQLWSVISVGRLVTCYDIRLYTVWSLVATPVLHLFLASWLTLPYTALRLLSEII